MGKNQLRGVQFPGGDTAENSFEHGGGFLYVHAGKTELQQVVNRQLAAAFTHADDDAIRAQAFADFDQIAGIA